MEMPQGGRKMDKNNKKPDGKRPKGGIWLPFVTGYDVNDYNNGYAGMGYSIDLVEVYYYTPSDVVKVPVVSS